MNDTNEFDKELAALISAEVDEILKELQEEATAPDVDESAASDGEAVGASTARPQTTEEAELGASEDCPDTPSDITEAPVGDDDSSSHELPEEPGSPLTEEELEAIRREVLDELLPEPTEEEAPPSPKVPLKAVFLGIAAAIVLLLAVIVGAVAVKVQSLDTIYPKVSVLGVDIGGLTVEEAEALLKAEDIGLPEKTAITLEMPGGSLELSYAEAGLMYSAKEIAEIAYSYGRDSGKVMQFAAYIISATTGMDYTDHVLDVPNEGYLEALLEGTIMKAELALNKDVVFDYEAATMTLIKGGGSIKLDRKVMLKQLVKAVENMEYGTLTYEPEKAAQTITTVAQLREEYGAEAVSAAYVKDTATITEETVGVDFDDAVVQPIWDAAETGDSVTLPILVTMPEYTKAWLEENLFSKTLGESVTSIRSSNSNRKNNIRLAIQAIDGIVLMPGEQFDYNQTLGQRTPQRGYLLAGAYMNGEVVESYGGGICQVSSGLYYCALLANQQIDDRSNHTFRVSYMPFSYDATVSWGGPEFKFTNTRSLPVRISASMTEDEVTVRIYGTDDGTNVKLSYSASNAYTDPEYPDVQTGYISQAVRRVYDSGGNLIKTEKMGTDFYQLHQSEIQYPSPTPTVTPTPESTPVMPTPTPVPTTEVTPTPTPAPTAEPTPTPASTPTPEPTPVPEQTGGEEGNTDQPVL